MTAILGLCACSSGGGSGGGGAVVPTIGSGAKGEETPIPGNTNPAQFVAAQDGGGESFPGAANTWDLSADFQLVDGGDDQFDGAMKLEVTVADVTESFPPSSYAELIWWTPLFSIATARVGDGSTTGGLLSGDYTLYTLPTADTRASQLLDLATAVPPIALSYLSNFDALANDRFAGEPRANRIVLRDAGGAILDTLYENDAGVETGSLGSAGLTAFAGQQVWLSFESQGSGRFAANRIDDVSVRDDDGVEFVRNGGFESGDLSDWEAAALGSPQNFQSAIWAFAGLQVTRSFYTAPGSLYGRWVDVFTNSTGAPISAIATYTSDLGSDGFGIVKFVDGSDHWAISAWDGRQGADHNDRDIAFVFGDAPEGGTDPSVGIRFEPDRPLGAGVGSDLVEWSHPIEVAAGEMATLVHFVVLDGTDTADTATGSDERPEAVEAEALRILESFFEGGFNEFSDGMTEDQLASVDNL